MECEKSANQGVVEAQEYLGTFYIANELGQTNLRLAKKWLSMAAEQGNTPAQNLLKVIQMAGEQITMRLTELKEALYTLKENGTEEQVQDLSWLQEMIDKKDLDVDLAPDWLIQAARSGDVDSQYKMGLSEFYGVFKRTTHKQARLWLTKAAEQGHVAAQYLLGYGYLMHLDLPHADYEQAKYWLEKAAAKDNADALYILGTMYLEGLGVNKDLDKAREYFSQAAKREHVFALMDLGKIYYNGLGTEVDYTKAKNLFLKASKLNHTEADFYLCKIYAYGQGIKPNPQKAQEHLQLALEEDLLIETQDLNEACDLYVQLNAKTK